MASSPFELSCSIDKERGHGWLSRLQPESKMREFTGGRGEGKMWSEVILAESYNKDGGFIIYLVALRRVFRCLTKPYEACE